MIRSILPDATVIDLSHTIERHSVLQGAAVLADAIPYLPVGVHVAVVDPGVGTSRRGVALSTTDGRVYVGPDNGVLGWAAARSGIEAAVTLRRDDPVASSDAVTFDGRDLFAPVAARLAMGASARALGEEIDPASLVRVEMPPIERNGDAVSVAILARDRFGTLQLAAGSAELDRLLPSERILVDAAAGVRRRAMRGRTFADVEPGELLFYADSFGRPSLAVRDGSAALQLGGEPGERLALRPD